MLVVLGVANLEFLELLSKQAMLQSSRFTLEDGPMGSKQRVCMERD